MNISSPPAGVRDTRISAFFISLLLYLDFLLRFCYDSLKAEMSKVKPSTRRAVLMKKKREVAMENKVGFDAMSVDQKMRFLQAEPKPPMSFFEKIVRLILWTVTGMLLMLGVSFWGGVCFKLFRWITGE